MQTNGILVKHLNQFQRICLLEENWDALRQHIKMYKDSYSTPYQELKRLLRVKKE